MSFKHVLILSGVAAESNTGSAMTTFWRTTGSAGNWDNTGSVRRLIGDDSSGRTAERQDGSGRSADYQCFGADDRPRRAAIVTRSGSESAFILRMT